MSIRVALGFVLMLPLVVLGGSQNLYVWSKRALAGSGGDAGEVGIVLATASALMFVAGVVVLWREHRESAEPS